MNEWILSQSQYSSLIFYPLLPHVCPCQFICTLLTWYPFCQRLTSLPQGIGFVSCKAKSTKEWREFYWSRSVVKENENNSDHKVKETKQAQILVKGWKGVGKPQQWIKQSGNIVELGRSNPGAHLLSEREKWGQGWGLETGNVVRKPWRTEVGFANGKQTSGLSVAWTCRLCTEPPGISSPHSAHSW